MIPFENLTPWPHEFYDLYSKIDIISIWPYDSTDMLHTQADDILTSLQLTSQQLLNLKNNSNAIFVYNLMFEGFSYKEHNLYKALTDSAIKHNIPTYKIFLFSGNLLEERTYNDWQVINSPNNKINVISWNRFETFSPDHCSLFNSTIDETVKHIRENSQSNFLCLNRVKRALRTMSIYKIVNSSISSSIKISYDTFTKNDILDAARELGILDIDDTFVENLIKSSPSTLDRTDFENNWVGHPKPLYENTLISIINETLYDTWNKTSLFYSEKTFRTMFSNHPIMIVGQQGLNTSFPIIGFRNYDAYFDLRFDYIENHWQRLNTQIDQLEDLNSRLNAMTNDQKINWILQGVDILQHNKDAIKEYAYTKNSMKKFVDRVKEIIS